MLQFVLLIIVMKWKHKNSVTFLSGTALFKAKRNILKIVEKTLKLNLTLVKNHNACNVSV
jgi:hypothetical protein